MKIIITEHDHQQRFDRWARKYCKPYAHISLSTIFAWIRKGAIRVNGRKRRENYRLKKSDCIQFHPKAASSLDHTPRELQSKKEKKQALTSKDVSHMIIYEDDHWLVFDKPPGVVMHGGHKQRENLSMHDYLQAYVYNTDIATSETFRPSFGYRLDKDTSGVLIAAKTYDALQYINKIIRQRKIKKWYEVVMVGHLTQEMDVREPLIKIYDKKYGRGKMVIAGADQDNPQNAHSHYYPIQTYTHPEIGACTHARVRIHTGRMHQIRVHAAHIGHPVLGDIIYGKPSVNRILYKKVGISRQLLHCSKYLFYDDLQNKEKHFSAPEAQDIRRIIEHSSG